MPTDLEALFTPIPMTDDEKELRAWIKLNRETLESMTPTEIGYMAITCGFDPAVVYAVLSNFRDAMSGTHVESRARFASWNFHKAMQHVDELKKKMAYVKELDLMPLWKDVTFYQTNQEVI